jgi:cob(I)alamin adenosyltransferase
MKIYTKTGDKGQTSLYGGTRVPKHHLRVEAYGSLDELNSFVGLAKAYITQSELNEVLKTIQINLFALGAVLATPVDKLKLANGQERLKTSIKPEDVELMEQEIDRMDEALPSLQYFILPSGGIAASHIHVARSVCRRAERLMVLLAEDEPIDGLCMAYVNRLSDYFFVLARFLAKENNEAEDFWIP